MNTTAIETIDGQEWVVTRNAAGQPIVKALHNPAPDSAVVEVTMRQARRALHAAGLLASVDAAIAGMTEPARTAAQIDWEFSNTVRRDNATFAALTAALGLSEAQIDVLFATARSL